ncbi:MAG TPA: nucleotide sugar dehydrogenase [Terriglobales bacterium]|nr:nucleotide sugar dehydrogenase [Terriglobales bacterium]
MHIGIYGSGYLGTVVAACLADFGMPVTVYDEHAALSGAPYGDVPYHEKNLKDMARRNLRAGRLLYSSNLETFAERSQVIFLAQDFGEQIDQAAQQLARLTSSESLLVIVTPVPVGTARRIQTQLDELGYKIAVVAHPLFLTSGCAVEDFNWPDRILLGTNSNQAVTLMKQIYRPLAMRGVPVIVTSFETAELVREAATAFVATKISFINEIASLCEHVNADAMDLALALGLDKKIAPRCLQPGAALGGQFVEGDLDALAQLASSAGVSLKIIGAAREVNRTLADRIIAKMSLALHSLQGREVGILGLSFKPHTNSVASSSSIQLAKILVGNGAHVRAYDPVAMADAKMELNGSVRYCETAYAAAEGVDALVLSTGWPEFRALDYDRIKRLQRTPVLVDTKNLLDATRMRGMGFQYVSIGRA